MFGPYAVYGMVSPYIDYSPQIHVLLVIYCTFGFPAIKTFEREQTKHIPTFNWHICSNLFMGPTCTEKWG